MRLYSGKIDSVSAEIVKVLLDEGSIEAEDPREVRADVASVLRTYVETERQVVEAARDMVQSRGLSSSDLGRTKRAIAEQKNIKIDDEALDYILDQVVAILMHSANVDEVFAEDVVMRRQMVPILKRAMAVDEELERETRAKIKHVAEGTRTWEIEYQRVMEDIRRRKGL